MKSLRRVQILLLSVLCIDCSGGLPPDHHRFAFQGVDESVTIRAYLARVEILRVSERDLDIASLRIGRIDALAVDSVDLVGLDAQECAVVVAPRERLRPDLRFGRCGEGPGELSDAVALAVFADTLYVLDREGRRIQMFGKGGEFFRALSLADHVSVMESATEIRVLSAQTAVVVFEYWRASTRLESRDRKGSGSAYLRIVELKDGSLLRETLRPGVGVENGERGVSTNASVCVRPVHESNAIDLVVANYVYPEFVQLRWRDDLSQMASPVRSQLVPELLLGKWESATKPPPPAYRVHMSCDDSSVHVVQIKARTRRDEPRSARAAIVGADGATVDADVSEALEGLGLMLASAADSMFFVQNERDAGPRITTVVLRQVPVRR